MNNKYIINERVLFKPEESKLKPLGARGREVVLNVPSSRILYLLLSKNGAVVTQDEIYTEVWEKYGQRVTPNALYQNVSLLRKALKSAGIVTLTIKTHPKSGFSYHGDIQVYEDESELPRKKWTDEPDLSRDLQQSQSIDEAEFSQTNNEEKKEAVSPSGKMTYWPVLRFTFFFVFITTVFLVLLPSSSDEHFTSEQNIVARVNGCPVYVDRGNRKVSLSKILVYLREKKIRCQEHDFLYMTKAPNKNEVIVMSCNSDEDDFKCRLLLKLPDYLTPDKKSILPN
ncbi:winged helix-turn-helix domain-containing protein [Enterobacter asburiae]|uniref:winged helix-turn-helix domain-containing protein n=1 Tax=Enterobacter asburiae TaxID=61645 RepID=UPI0027F418C3|nr:winged helix-turn-helix domain-containing protein [Enterobacter asburiae]